MTEANGSLTRYLSEDGIQIIHAELDSAFREAGEPMPPFSLVNREHLDALIKLPQSRFFGVEQYPTLESKAAIIFYTINKKHLFLNGNKRMSVLTLLVFLGINQKKLNITPDELTEKALWLAKKTHEHDFIQLKNELEQWLRSHIMDA